MSTSWTSSLIVKTFYNSDNSVSKRVKSNLSLVRALELDTMKTDSELLRTLSAADILAAYADHLVALGKGKNYDLTRTALLRYTLPGWTNVYPSQGKATAAQIAQGLTALSQITLEQFKDALAVQAKVFDHMQLDKKQRRQPRCYLTQLLTWAGTQGYSSNHASGNESPSIVIKEPFRLSRPKGQGRLMADSVKLRNTPHHKPYALGAVAGDVIYDDLKKQLNALKAYLAQNKQREPTIKKHLMQVMQMLGWLHREKGIPFDTLSLESLVLFVPIQPKWEHCLYRSGKHKGEFDQNRYDVKKGTLIRLAKEKAKATKTLVEEYLTWQGRHPDSDVIATVAVISVAKYLYRDETDDDEYDNFEDIPVIRRLRKLVVAKTEEAKNAIPAVPYTLKSIPWEETKKVILAVQFEADLKTRPSTGQPRSDGAVATSIQTLLILLLFMSHPPDRSRTLYEFEVGRTLRFGQYKDERFTEAKDLPLNVKALWWIHLESKDYKTGNTYGEVWDKLHDTVPGFLADGKTMYDYLDLWLKQYRTVFKPTHNCLLTARHSEALDATSLREKVRDVFFKHTGVPVSPKEIRKMYVTFLKTSGASEQVMEGARNRMRHSQKMQNEDYDQQARLDKVAHVDNFHAQSLML